MIFRAALERIFMWLTVISTTTSAGKKYYEFRFKKEACPFSAVKTVRRLYEASPELQTNPSRSAMERLIADQGRTLLNRENELMRQYKIEH